MSCAVRLTDVSVSYRRHLALHGVTLEFHRNDFIGVVGPNGSGKTTLLTVINGLGRIRGGRVRILGREANPGSFGRLRPRIGYVPQRAHVDPRAPITCFDAVMIGRLGRIGLLRRPGRADHEKVLRMMVSVGIADLRDRPVGQVSGGESQKVALARALVQEPELLLLDEPDANLDRVARPELLRLIEDAHRRLSLTTVMVTHRPESIPSCCNRVVLLRAGRVLFDGGRVDGLSASRLAGAWGHG